MKICIAPDCDRRALAKGLCHSHYQNKRQSELRAAVRAEHRPCAQCGGDLAGKRPNAKFCSDQCKGAWFLDLARAETMRRQAGRVCVQCGGSITSSSGKAQTCSRACGVAYQNAKRRASQLAVWNARKKPCPRCGSGVPDERWGALYCSERCKRGEQDARWRKRAPGYMRQYLYGITPEEFTARLVAQDNRCAICRTDAPGGKGGWHVDHDHGTSMIRGLLCNGCNLLLGHSGDDPVRLHAALAYLEMR